MIHQADCVLCGMPLPDREEVLRFERVWICDEHDYHQLEEAGVEGLGFHDHEYAKRTLELNALLHGQSIAQLRFTAGERFGLLLDLDTGDVLEVWPSVRAAVVTRLPKELVQTRNVRGFSKLDVTTVLSSRGPFDDGDEKRGLREFLEIVSNKIPLDRVVFETFESGEPNSDCPALVFGDRVVSFEGVGWSAWDVEPSTDIRICWTLRSATQLAR